jgi:hypothetical protein
MENSEDAVFDECVICATPTCEPITRDVQFRAYYIEGAGQLCKTCYDGEYREYIPQRH